MKNAMAICVSVAAVAMGSASLAPVLAQSGSYERAERSTREGPTANQLVDEADSRIARLKADLRLTPEQADKWGDLQKVLHDRAVRSAESWIKLREEIADQRQRAREERRRYSNRSDRDASTAPPAPDVEGTATGTPPGSTDKTVTGDRSADRPATDTRADTARVEPARADPDDDIASMRRRADALTTMAADLRKIADASEPLYRVLDVGQRHVLIRFVTASDRDQSDEGRRRYRR
ncbi:hypothetical protein PY365_05870 [Roseiarcaceae bacterium H3SJ34-1]|uniref:hypothetical protein n=1 Tax=Terripilifer ovatus TaxID=3032367 RepID=UPI003AB99D4A|nr:hypothetical protein [Roseiarcaceae bacterium H3SJ34-1]